MFINKEIEKKLSFNAADYSFFLDLLELKQETKGILFQIIQDMKELPGAIGGHHGDYKGGLFDHTLLVTNLTYQILKDPKNFEPYFQRLKQRASTIKENYKNIDQKKAILCALYHDFGKVSYYGLKKKISPRYTWTKRMECRKAHRYIIKKYRCSGEDKHVSECFAVLMRYDLNFDDEMAKAIIFHHGKFSRYKPFKPNALAKLIHLADTIASKIYNI